MPQNLSAHAMGKVRVSRHFWPRTLRTQDISVVPKCLSALVPNCPEIWALVPKCLMDTSAKCLTDTSAPRKTLRHRATLDQAMATVDGCANITVCENKFSINLRNVSIYTTHGLWNQYHLKIWFCKVQNLVSDRYWYQTLDFGISAVIRTIGKGNCNLMSDMPNLQHLVYDETWEREWESVQIIHFSIIV